MKQHLRVWAPLMLGVSFIAGAAWLNAQIADTVEAHVNHRFMVGDKTLPPGDYTFRMEPKSDMGVMTVQNKKGDFVDQFSVRQSIDSHTPKHTELMFRKYGNTEFLSKVYEGGSKNGIAVTENSNAEKKLLNDGRHGLEHTEEQQ